MQILKKILIAIVVIVVLLLVVAIFLPSEYHVSRSIEINRPDSVVFEKVANYNHRAGWDPWLSMEPGAKTGVSGPVGEPGSQWYWDGEKIGKGRMTIEEVEKNRRIKSKLEFIEPQSGESDVAWQFTPTANGTQVSWSFSGQSEYPIGRYFGLMMDSMVGGDFEKGLANLKNVCEQ
jgi:uncharacterized protein YndB with AHSA1/START domain